MNILQICSAREIGGGERHLTDLADSLARRGHNVYVALAPDSPLINELSSVPRHRIVELRMRNSLDLRSAMKLARFTREHSIDIIHAHLARDYPLAAFVAWRSGNTPYVLTRHVLFPLKMPHRIILRHAVRVVAVSQAVNDALRRQKIFDDDTIVTIHNGIDIDRFAGRIEKENAFPNKEKKTGPFLVGVVGHLSRIKGQEDFIRAAAIIASRRTDVDFLIVGEDKSPNGENRAALEGLIAKLGVAERVRITGWLDDVKEILDRLDIFVSPSRSEPFGLAIIEAMACDVPVVASMSEGAREIIEDNVTGRLVPVVDAIALADTIDELLTNTSERDRLAANALASVRQRFTLERMVDETEQLYADVLADSKKT